MLLIRRKPGESVLIGQEIEIRVLETSPARVVLGIVAPRTIPVLRNEVKETIEQNREAAGSLSPMTLEAVSSLVRSGFGPPGR
jgi:carbon storage regulator